MGKIILSIGGGLILLGLLGWFSAARKGEPAAVVNSLGGEELIAESSSFDFGEVSMAKGVVKQLSL